MSFGEHIDFEQMDPQEAQLLVGRTLAEMTYGVNTLGDADFLRAIPPLSTEAVEKLSMPIDELAIEYAPKGSGTLGAAKAYLQWNGDAPFYRAGHVAMLGKNALISIPHISSRRANMLGDFISRTCALPVPDIPSPELSAYICDNPGDIPASILLQRGRRLALAYTSMATLFGHGVPSTLEGLTPNSFSPEKALDAIQRFENRYWLARAILQPGYNNPSHKEIGA